MKKICIFGIIDSIWTLKCVEKPRLWEKANITMYGLNGTAYRDWYLEHGVSLVNPKLQGPLYHIPKVRGAVSCLRYMTGSAALCRKQGPFDVIHVSFLSIPKLMLLPLFRRYCGKLVCTFWGSDLMRERPVLLRLFRRALAQADIITLSTEEMERRFLEVFGDGFRDKLRRIRFGVEGLDALAALNCSRDEVRRQLQLPSDKLVVAIGYNGHECQNHLRVLQVISELPVTCREKLFLQFPLTYGLTPGYRTQLLSAIEKTGCPYQLIETFQNLDALARLRMSTDLFIHAQQTDAFSASVQEYLYAEKPVLNPAWIAYPDLVKNGVYYMEYRDFEDLREKLLSILNHGISSADHEKLHANREKLEKLSSWRSVAKDWEALYL